MNVPTEWRLRPGLARWVLLSVFFKLLSTVAEEPTALVEGQRLARQYCAACHLFPEPSLLDQRTWREGTEPAMLRIMGFNRLDTNAPDGRDLMRQWRLIWDWYYASAPAKALPQPPRLKTRLTLTNFTALPLDYRPTNRMTTLVRIDPVRHQLYAGNQDARSLDVLDSRGRMLSTLPVESPAVGLVERPDGWYVPLIWSLSPHDTRQGKVLKLARDGDAFRQSAAVIVDLPRPTCLAVTDLNGDGRDDVVTCGYGNVLGAFSWWENTGSGYTEHVLLDRAGATHVEVADLNGDGRPDLVVQMAQAREGLYWFENRGAGGFIPHTIAEFPPTWGSSSFILVDLDRDGLLDVVATNGDNGEYNSCLKPYHGIRLYRNTAGKGHPPAFTETWFFPLHGAYGVRAMDFDGDGDLDLAAISYFADYDGAREDSFVVLWNDGAGTWRPETLDEGMSGRWIVMDAGDLDGDGAPDIVLGASNRVPFRAPKALYSAWESSGPTLLLLHNERHR